MAKFIEFGETKLHGTAFGKLPGRTGFLFASAFGTAGTVKKVIKDLKSRLVIGCDYEYATVTPDIIEIKTSRIPNSDYSHIVVSRRDHTEETGLGESSYAYIYMDEEDFTKNLWEMYREKFFHETFLEKVYDKLYKLTSVPVLKEWMPFIMERFYLDSKISEGSVIKSSPKGNLRCFCLEFEKSYLISTISEGLKDGKINIDGKTASREMKEEIRGIDSYLNHFNRTLAERIRTSFRPHFIPGEDSYSNNLNALCEYIEYHHGIKLYPAQKDVVQAVSNNLDNERAAIIVGECGSGKTCLATTAVNAHSRNKRGLLNIVMCPSHLVHKWKEEIERWSPNSDAVVVPDFSSLLQMEKTAKDSRRRRNLWLVISKETAKYGYEERPAAVWSETKKCFCCPECGKPLYKNVYTGEGRRRRVNKCLFGKTEFLRKTAENLRCMNETAEEDMSDERKTLCGAKLWEAFGINKSRTAAKWIKIKSGWLLKNHVKQLTEELMSKFNLNRNDNALLEELGEYQALGEAPSVRAPRKYPLSKYVRSKFKNHVDYFIADELHELKGGDTAQGEAFGDFVFAAKKTIGLTGTLLNGYASGIYYILFRMFPEKMKREGFSYRDWEDFASVYGVTERTDCYAFENNRQGQRRGSGKTKFKPGVSPLVFTKFLMENTAFISLEDISEGLPGYKEIPVGVEMDSDLEREYRGMESRLRYRINPYNGGMRVMADAVQTLTVYPDQPFGIDPVIDRKDGAVIVEPADLDRNTLRNKEKAMLDLIEEKKAAGEKVLLYYHWVNKTELGKRLKNLLQEKGIRAEILSNSVKAAERSQWIEEKLQKGTDVIICNPSLVETGLDLLSFTTIVFYQLGYNLYTMRQASRRSWRLSQNKDVEVYFFYYRDTVQEKALSLMATKLQAAMAIEGKFSEEGLNAMSNNEDILTQIASSVTEGIKEEIGIKVFEKISSAKEKAASDGQPESVASDRKNSGRIIRKIESVRKRSRKTAPTGSTLSLVEAYGIAC